MKIKFSVITMQQHPNIKFLNWKENLDWVQYPPKSMTNHIPKPYQIPPINKQYIYLFTCNTEQLAFWELFTQVYNHWGQRWQGSNHTSQKGDNFNCNIVTDLPRPIVCLFPTPTSSQTLAPKQPVPATIQILSINYMDHIIKK